MSSISIQNRHGFSMLIDESDLGLLSQHKDGYWCFYVGIGGYAQISCRRESGSKGRNPVLVHRLIMGFPIGLEVNYINGNKLDNRRENLRLCTKSQNTMNTPGRGVSRFKGVYQKRGKYLAAIKTNGKQIYLGTFAIETEAALAYDAAAMLEGGKYRTLNFPDEATND